MLSFSTSASKPKDIKSFLAIPTEETEAKQKLKIAKMPPKSKIAAKRNDKVNSKKGRKKGSDDEAYVADKADKKKEKAEKDPNAPKKPQTAYFLFMNANRAKVKEAEPDLKFGDMTKKLTAMYKALSEEELKEWNDKANEDKERYNAEMEAKGLAKAKKAEPPVG